MLAKDNKDQTDELVERARKLELLQLKQQLDRRLYENCTTREKVFLLALKGALEGGFVASSYDIAYNAVRVFDIAFPTEELKL